MSSITFVDMDETLVKSFAKIGVRREGEVVRTLSNQEFNDYTLGDSEEYDFSEFGSADIFQSSLPLQGNIDHVFEEHGDTEIAILTARGDFDDREKFLEKLRSFGIPVGHYKDGKIHVIRCATEGLRPCDAKFLKIRKILERRDDVEEITLIDDSRQNLQVLRDCMLSLEFGVRVFLKLATEDGIQDF